MKFLDARLERLHRDGTLHLLLRERERDELDDDGEDEDLLDGLWEDLDLRALLPGTEVAEGDTWEIDAADLLGILVAGGDLKIGADEELPDFGDMEEGQIMIVMPNVPDDPMMWLEDLEGEIAAEYQGLRDTGEFDVAVVALELEIQSAAELSEWLSERMPGRPDMDAADLTISFEGEGELLWNLEEGHFHSLEIEGEVAVEYYVAWGLPAGPATIELEMTQELEGSIAITARLGEEDDE